MPPRFAYWTILVGGLPTAFRAAERDEIEPTFRRLQQKHPDAEMRWFARGKLWASPEESGEALARQKAEGRRQKPDFRERDRNWRPGGSHHDPRQPYFDAKKRENQRRRERRFEFKQRPESRHKAQGTGRKEEQPEWKWGRPPQKARPESGDRRPETGDRRPPKTEDRRPKTDRPWTPKPAWKPKPKPWQGPEPGARSPESRDRRPPKTEDRRPNTDRPWTPKPAWKPRPKPWRGPGPEREGRGPQSPGSRPQEQRPKWKRPPGHEKPDGDKPWKPKPWQGPKTEDRRPKTETGQNHGRSRWSAGGARKGPGKGRR